MRGGSQQDRLPAADRATPAFILQQQNVMLQNAELNACPHACFAAYALPAADRATPCSPFVFSKLKNFKVVQSQRLQKRLEYGTNL
jgi:hypothetical protein